MKKLARVAAAYCPTCNNPFAMAIMNSVENTIEAGKDFKLWKKQGHKVDIIEYDPEKTKAPKWCECKFK